MSLTGSGPDDPQRVGVPIADLLAGMYGAYGVLAALHERDRTGGGTVVRTSLLAAHSSACTRSRAPAGPSPARSGRRRATTTRRSLPTGCSTAATGRSRSLWAARAVAPLLRRASGRPDSDGLATNPERVANRSGRSRSSSRSSPSGTPNRSWRGSTRSASPPERCAPSTRSTRGTRPRSQGLLVDVEHSVSARSRCRGLRCGSSEPTAPRLPAGAPGTADARRARPAVRAWLRDDPAPVADEPALVGPGPDRPGARRRDVRVLGPARRHQRPLRELPGRARAAAERAGTDESVLTGRASWAADRWSSW